MSAKYPEHAKLSARNEEYEHLCQFVEWLDEQGGGLFWQVEGEEVRFLSDEAIIARYFGIDLKELEAEKRAMQKSLQERMEEMEVETGVRLLDRECAEPQNTCE